jgi:hypothetical protein
VANVRTARSRALDSPSQLAVEDFEHRTAMTVLPFNPDPRLVAVLSPLFLFAGALAIGLPLRRVVDRFLEDDDPRRYYASQAILYGGTFVIIPVSVWLQHR